MRGSLKVSPLLIAVLVFVSLIAVGYFVFFHQTDQSNKQVNQIKNENNQPQALYLTTMTHLEDGWEAAATEEGYFKRVASEVRYGMGLASEYDAVLTFETGLPFAEGCVNFDDNVMAEVLERGHGIGVHPDLPPKTELPVSVATTHIKERVDALKELVGDDEIIGCSGVGGKSDWYTASKAAGCDFLDGVVGFYYLTMPMNARPKGYTDEAILDVLYHQPVPTGDERFYPFWIDSSKDFVPDENGDILLSSGETFSLEMYAEAGSRNGDWPRSSGEYHLLTDDVEVFVAEITDFAKKRDTARIAKFNVYIPASFFTPENKEILAAFFKEAQKLQEQGIVEWASQAEVYEAMVEER